MEKIILLKSNLFADGDQKLQETLMGSFLRKLWASPKKPDAIIFYGTAVKLLAKGSSVLDALTGLEEEGVELLGCGTCLGYYEVEGDLMAGRKTSMSEVIELMMNAKSVITP